ncbi:hypothetical protein AVEN_101518-1 [Araneus ventricosus]|uniref:Uncharacterized protein n=1 Tax=Araneus ventricosus TaxID=182803 RepID=A0A4Y2VZF1_ARAVE|nr:hypothetical protein AVEN_101518-1 [Araneus ventricosus]
MGRFRWSLNIGMYRDQAREVQLVDGFMLFRCCGFWFQYVESDAGKEGWCLPENGSQTQCKWQVSLISYSDTALEKNSRAGHWYGASWRSVAIGRSDSSRPTE